MATDYPIGPDEDRFIEGVRMTEEGGAEVDMLPGEEPDVEELPDGSAVVKSAELSTLSTIRVMPRLP